MTTDDRWGDGGAYDQYMGRWSRDVAAVFLEWLAIPAGNAWADIGCGTGGLTERILAQAAPSFVAGIDRATGFVAAARTAQTDNRAHFAAGDATNLPLATHSMHAAVSGLVLNFVDNHRVMVDEMARVVKRKGRVGIYVWDYADEMKVLRLFWDAAVAVDWRAAELDEGVRFPVCRPHALRALFESTGLREVSLRAIEVQAFFPNFDAYWRPFLGGIGPAPTYLASAGEPIRAQIRQVLQERLTPDLDRGFMLTARAWAVQGTV